MKRLVKRPEAGGDKFRFSLEIISETQVGGHVLDPADLEQRLVVELLIDGYPAAIARADLYDPELARAGLGDGCHGFVFSIDPAALQTFLQAQNFNALIKRLGMESGTRHPALVAGSPATCSEPVAGDPATSAG